MRWRRLFPGTELQDIMSSMNQMLDMVTAFISFVAGISLLVGGIGVMNIMPGVCD